jgi:N-sulfoglucosamine sulfohydrolase
MPIAAVSLRSQRSSAKHLPGKARSGRHDELELRLRCPDLSTARGSTARAEEATRDRVAEHEPNVTPTRPNILHVIPHDLGRELGCHGRAWLDTPRLDALAAEGMRFDGYTCASTPCSPSRGCIQTGRYAHRSGLLGLVNRGWELPVSVPTVADALGAAGYETLLAGFQHERRRRADLRYARDLSSGAGGREEPGDMLIERGVERVAAFLRERRADDRPFFLNLGSWETHAPWTRPEYRPFLPRPDDVVVPPFLPDAPLTRAQLARFAAAVAFLDRQIGRLLDVLRETGLEQDTLVAFTTDHGIAFPRAKSTLYEPGLATTLILRWPGEIPAGRVATERIPNVDLLPTYCEAAGAEPPAGVDGRSFWRLARGEPGYAPRERVFAERNFHDDFDPQRAVVQGRFKLVRNLARRRARSHPRDMDWMRQEQDLWRGFLDAERPFEQLFDLDTDPDELRDLSDEPHSAGILAELRGALERWMEETGDFLRGAVEPVFFPAQESGTELDHPTPC